MSDGDLRTLLKNHVVAAQWTAIETGATVAGVPDAEYCFPQGISGWVECKATSGFTIDFRGREYQVAWLERRARLGGRAFVAVRRRARAGPRRGRAVDLLYLYPALAARGLMVGGLRSSSPLGLWEGGPARWAWHEVEAALKK